MLDAGIFPILSEGALRATLGILARPTVAAGGYPRERAGPARDEVRAGSPHVAVAPGQRPLPHLVELGPGRHLLGDQRRLDPVEQPFEPSDQLGVGDAELGLRETS